MTTQIPVRRVSEAGSREQAPWLWGPGSFKLNDKIGFIAELRSNLLVKKVLGDGSIDAWNQGHPSGAGFAPPAFAGQPLKPHSHNEIQGVTPMKTSAKDQMAGKLHEIKGTVKEITGRATDDPQLETEGTAEKISGTVQRKIGQVKKVFGK
jgi:uncharacterized protein YjbJ (UPF0337 family)